MKKMSRLYFPDVILGVYTDDELQDAQPLMDVTPSNEFDEQPVQRIDSRPTLTEKQIEQAIKRLQAVVQQLKH